VRSGRAQREQQRRASHGSGATAAPHARDERSASLLRLLLLACGERARSAINTTLLHRHCRTGWFNVSFFWGGMGVAMMGACRTISRLQKLIDVI
jgi:hypothetical protein